MGEVIAVDTVKTLYICMYLFYIYHLYRLYIWTVQVVDTLLYLTVHSLHIGAILAKFRQRFIFYINV